MRPSECILYCILSNFSQVKQKRAQVFNAVNKGEITSLFDLNVTVYTFMAVADVKFVFQILIFLPIRRVIL